MENKKNIRILNTSAGSLRRIPLGMNRPVEQKNAMQKRHPVRDATLTGCTGRNIRTFSTERHIPDGMSKTITGVAGVQGKCGKSCGSCKI